MQNFLFLDAEFTICIFLGGLRSTAILICFAKIRLMFGFPSWATLCNILALEIYLSTPLYTYCAKIFHCICQRIYLKTNFLSHGIAVENGQLKAEAAKATQLTAENGALAAKVESLSGRLENLKAERDGLEAEHRSVQVWSPQVPGETLVP